MCQERLAVAKAQVRGGISGIKEIAGRIHADDPDGDASLEDVLFAVAVETFNRTYPYPAASSRLAALITGASAN